MAKDTLTFQQQMQLFRFNNLKNMIRVVRRILFLPGAKNFKRNVLNGISQGINEYLIYVFDGKDFVNCEGEEFHQIFMEESKTYKKLHIPITCNTCPSAENYERFNTLLRYYCLCEETINERVEEIIDQSIVDWRKEVDKHSKK